MKKQALLAILKQGMKTWNAWRQEHPEIHPDLSHLDLSGSDFSDIWFQNVKLHHADLSACQFQRALLNDADLHGANCHDTDFTQASFHHALLEETNFANALLQEADLSQTALSDACFVSANLYRAILNNATMNNCNFTRADLSEASLQHTNLVGSIFEETNASQATLQGTLLRSAHFRRANLSRTNMSEANLCGTIFDHTLLHKTDFTNAIVGWSTWNDVDLREGQGLSTMTHLGPSDIGINTFYRSQGMIDPAFLTGAGIPVPFQNVIPTVFMKQEPPFLSGFICYSSQDHLFAQQLERDLRQKQIRCWLAPMDMKGRNEFWSITQDTHLIYDILFIVYSHYSNTSSDFASFIREAMSEETERGKRIIFPVKVDHTISETKVNRKNKILDFTNWTIEHHYQKAFQDLFLEIKQAYEIR